MDGLESGFTGGGGQGDFRSAVFEGEVDFFESVEPHMGTFIAGTIGGGRCRDVVFTGGCFLHLMDDAWLRSDDKGIAIASLGVVQQGGGGTDIVRMAEDRGLTFRVGENRSAGVLPLQLHQLFLREDFVDHAAAVPQD